MSESIIVIPDIHNKYWLADKVINRWAGKPGDLKIICLGDYFDDWDDDYEDAAKMARWLKDFHDAGGGHYKTVRILGNHDMPYLYPELVRYIAFPGGYTDEKATAIQSVLDVKAFRKTMTLSTVVGSWLLSHAGLTNHWLIDIWDYDFPPQAKHLNAVLEGIKEGFLDVGKMSPLVGRGVDRGGLQPYGGVTWAGWEYFVTTQGLNQLVGHTQEKHVRYRNTRSKNICLDTRMRHYAVYNSTDDDWEIRSI